jgi:GNAT superfamily N-acetyltransferase
LFGHDGRAIVFPMKEALVDVVAVPEPGGVSRWLAMASPGSVAAVADLRPIIAGAAELTLHVEPEWRRRGVGSLLLAVVREHTDGRHLVVDVAAGSPGEAFCVRHGFRHTRSWRRDLLIYCDVHQAWLGELVDAEHPGYRLVHWTGDLSAVPDLEELPSRSLLTAAAADGELAAYAVAVVGPLWQPRARQHGPAILSGHHGRHLGRWVNAALIQRLREVHPHVDEIDTAPGEDESGVRRHLGFRPQRRTRLYELAPTLKGLS